MFGREVLVGEWELVEGVAGFQSLGEQHGAGSVDALPAVATQVDQEDPAAPDKFVTQSGTPR